MIDLHGLFRARWFGRRGAPAIPLYAPEGVLLRVCGLEADHAETVQQVFDWHPLPAQPCEIGPLRLESRALPHFVINSGVRISTASLTVAYTGDTGPDPALAELGRNADLYIVEATTRNQQLMSPPAANAPRMHLTDREAGEAAARAGAKRLLLTHFWPENDRERSRIAAAEVFDGEVLVAEEGLEVTLP